jgi:hypothetical protein
VYKRNDELNGQSLRLPVWRGALEGQVSQLFSGVNLLVLFLVACVALALWGPKRARWVRWAIPIGAALLVLYLIVTSYHRV